MKVLVFSHSGNFYGANSCLMETIVGLRPSGFEFNVVSPTEGRLQGKLDEIGVSHSLLPVKPWSAQLKTFRSAKRLLQSHVAARSIRGWAETQEFDVIYTNTVRTLVGGILAKRLGVPHLWHIHEQVSPFEGNPLARKLLQADRFVGVSQFICDQIAAAVPQERIDRVYNGPVDDRRPRPAPRTGPPAGPLELLCVGRVTPRKRHLDAIGCLAALVGRGHDARLSIAGEPRDQKIGDTLQAAADRLGVGNRFAILGYQNEMDAVYRRATINLFPSDTEPFGRVVPEALATGCPTVGVLGGAVPEIIEDERSGLLVPPRDPEALANAVERLLEPDLHAEISRGSIERAFGAFGQSLYASNMKDAITRVTEQRPDVA